MRINFPAIKYTLGTSSLAGMLLMSSPDKIIAQNKNTQDTYIRASVPAQGSEDSTILAYAPSPDVKILGKNRKAVIVVDVDNNILYHYNSHGKAITAYSAATGKISTPTHKGVRIVSHIEIYPYETAAKWSKRRRYPESFGPKIIHLNTINPLTGSRGDNGEYIHGNNNPESIGKKISHGCIRLDNKVIEKLADIIKPGDIVLIK